MAIIGTKNTLLDVAKRLDPNGKIDAVAEVLTRQNEILEDMPWIECNDGTSHKTTVRSGLPSATWRLLNYGVQPQKSTTRQIKDSTGMLETYSEIDKALAELNNNSADFRASEDVAFLEGMNQQLAQTLFYGNVDANPERFMGLAPRFSSLSASVPSSANIINGGGAGATNTSIWLVVWGPQTVHGIYPKGSKAGLNQRDLGEQTVSDGNGGQYQALRTHYKWDPGFCVRDWRYVVRIANVDVSTLTKTGATGADIIDLMVQALEVVQDLKLGTPVFYCNRTIKSFLRRQMLNKSNVNLSLADISGKKVMMFDEVPVKLCEAILNTEAAVV